MYLLIILPQIRFSTRQDLVRCTWQTVLYSCKITFIITYDEYILCYTLQANPHYMCRSIYILIRTNNSGLERRAIYIRVVIRILMLAYIYIVYNVWIMIDDSDEIKKYSCSKRRLCCKHVYIFTHCILAV